MLHIENVIIITTYMYRCRVQKIKRHNVENISAMFLNIQINVHQTEYGH